MPPANMGELTFESNLFTWSAGGPRDNYAKVGVTEISTLMIGQAPVSINVRSTRTGAVRTFGTMVPLMSREREIYAWRYTDVCQPGLVLDILND